MMKFKRKLKDVKGNSDGGITGSLGMLTKW